LKKEKKKKTELFSERTRKQKPENRVKESVITVLDVLVPLVVAGSGVNLDRRRAVFRVFNTNAKSKKQKN
jgi:hypothetical protein